MNEILAGRLRTAFAGRRNITEKRMFGGVCFLLRGNMLCGIGKADFMFRVGKAQDAEALSRRGARPMDITGRIMKGFVWVDPKACDRRTLGRWLELAEKFVGKLPAKAARNPQRGDSPVVAAPRRGLLADASAARAEFQRSGKGYALAEVIVSKRADADLDRLVRFLGRESLDTRITIQEDIMHPKARFLFIANMDVDPDKEALFNEVYDTEHIPELLKVPGVLAVHRYTLAPLKMSIGGEVKTIVAEGEPKHSATYELESAEVLTSPAWATAVEKGRWPAQVRPYTRNRRHTLRKLK